MSPSKVPLFSWVLAATLVVQLQTVVCKNGDSYLFGIEQISLNADGSTGIWNAIGVNESSGLPVTVPATVPGGIYSDLEENGILSSKIYHEYNDVENRWVGRTNWSYARTFEVTQDLLEKESVVLVCEGLDTISEVLVNLKEVGTSDNMFVRYIFDIKSALVVGENSIIVRFKSPVRYAQGQYQQHIVDYGYPVLPETVPDAYRGEYQAQMIRKIQSQFSWDWGPSYPNSGIWKNIYIQGYSSAVMRDVMIFPKPSKEIPDDHDEWTVTARVYYDSAVENEEAKFEFYKPGGTKLSTTVQLEKGIGKSVDLTLTEGINSTKLWWPNGYGEQHLYSYNVTMSSQDGSEVQTRILRIGFRKVELVEDFVDSQKPEMGREFFFRVNGVQMYSKGSNSIPLHVLPERITAEQTEWLFRAAKMSHQNIIRVWGGGMYETEEFYDLADEYGVFIWEDFQFAVAMYPATDEFLATVKQEVETQVKRLQYRTSLVLWAGNNENEGALRGNWFGTWDNFEIYKRDYVKLYAETIKVLVEELDPSRQYIASSPTNGIRTEEEGWVAEDPYSLIYGDTHPYDYQSDNWDWRMFRRTRFASEYGYQSFPHYETLEKVADNITTWSWESAQMDHRQRHAGGQIEIRELIRKHLPFPRDHDSPEALPYMLYMAQLSQVMGQKTQTESYRRLMDKMAEDGTGHNMGAQYWQLNDIWEGCSWSSVEVNGKWKLQMYYAIRFFSPVLPSPYLEDGSGDLVVELISDLYEANPSNEQSALFIEIYKLSSMDTIYSERIEVTPKFLRSPEVHRVSSDTLKTLGCGAAADSDEGAQDPCFVHVNAVGYTDNFLFLHYPRNINAVKDPNLRITETAALGDGHTVIFNLKSDAIAPFVFLTVRGDDRGYFSDNGYIQLSEDKQLTYYSEHGITAQQFLEKIEIMSLFDVGRVAG